MNEKQICQNPHCIVIRTRMSTESWTDQLKEGDWVSRVSYMKVKAIRGSSFHVANETGFEWVMEDNIVQQECNPAFGYLAKKKVSRTELVRLLLEDTHSAVVSLNFTKKQTPERILEMIEEADMSKMNKTQKKKFAESLMIGEPRNLVGYVIGSDQNGRIRMIDLNIQDSNRERLVDPRTLKDVTFGGNSYHCD